MPLGERLRHSLIGHWQTHLNIVLGEDTTDVIEGLPRGFFAPTLPPGNVNPPALPADTVFFPLTGRIIAHYTRTLPVRTPGFEWFFRAFWVESDEGIHFKRAEAPIAERGVVSKSFDEGFSGVLRGKGYRVLRL